MTPSHPSPLHLTEDARTHQHAPPSGVVRVGVRGHGPEALPVGEPGEGAVVPRPAVQVLCMCMSCGASSEHSQGKEARRGGASLCCCRHSHRMHIACMHMQSGSTHHRHTSAPAPIAPPPLSRLPHRSPCPSRTTPPPARVAERSRCCRCRRCCRCPRRRSRPVGAARGQTPWLE